MANAGRKGTWGPPTKKYEHLFCGKCGALLDLPEGLHGGAKCPFCGFRRQVKSLRTLELVHHSGPEDFVKRYALDPLVPLAPDLERADEEEKDKKRQRAIIDEDCPKCGHPQMEYYTLQLRSADEGQTVFYECVKCKFKFSQNN